MPEAKVRQSDVNLLLADASRATAVRIVHVVDSCTDGKLSLNLATDPDGFTFTRRRLKIGYLTYSYLLPEGFGLDESPGKLLPYVAFISVKDARGTPDHHEYLLPGDGNIDYARYFRTLNSLAIGVSWAWKSTL